MKKDGAKPRKRTPRDDLWDVVVELWFSGGPLAGSHRKRIGRLVRELTEMQALPQTVRERYETAIAQWPTPRMATPEAIISQWFALSHKPPTETDDEAALARRDMAELAERRRARS